MSVILYSGAPQIERRIKSVSTSFPINSFVQSSFGDLIPATSGSTSIAGITAEEITSTSPSYALNGAKMSIITPDDDSVFLIDYVNGTPVQGGLYDLFNADTIDVSASVNKNVVCIEVMSSTQALFKIKSRETVGGGAGGAASTLQASYTAGSQILYDGSHPVTVRAGGAPYEGFSAALFAADTVGATPFGIGFSLIKTAAGPSSGFPGISWLQQCVNDTNVTFPTNNTVDFGIAVDLVAAGLLPSLSTVTIKHSNVPGDESIYGIASFSSSGGGTNNIAHLGTNYKTFAPANITSTTGIATAGLQGGSVGGNSTYFASTSYAITNPATGTHAQFINWGGSGINGVLVQNNAGVMTTGFEILNEPGASLGTGLEAINAAGGTRTGAFIDIVENEPTNAVNVVNITNFGTGKDIKTTNAEIRKDGGIQCSYVRAILPTGDGHSCISIQNPDAGSASVGIDISNAGTGKDISGTSATWGVTKTGNISGATLNLSGIVEYADNAAALAGGLVIGDLYRTVDALKIVH